MIYILMGPSGAGKTRLGGILRDMGMQELVSHTTRKPRTLGGRGQVLLFCYKG